MKIANRVLNVQEYYFSKKLVEVEALKKQGKKILNLGIGSPDLPPHPKVIEALTMNAEKPNVHGYQSYRGIPELRVAFAEWYNAKYHVVLDSQSEILPLIGSKEGIMHICMSYLQEGDLALVPNPGYPTYSSAVSLSGALPIYYSLSEENQWRINRKEFENFPYEKIKILWLNYPHMPTGVSMHEEDIEFLIELAKKKDFLICHDNPYSFIRSEKPQSILKFKDSKEVCLELNSLSKSHNMAGWRMGVLTGKKEYIDTVIKFKSNMDSGMFFPLQKAAIEALRLPDEWYQNLNKIYFEREKNIHEFLDSLQSTYVKKQLGLFVWAKFPKQFKDSYSFTDKLLYENNIFVTPGEIFGSEGKNYFRVSLCNPNEVVKEAIERIKK